MSAASGAGGAVSGACGGTALSCPLEGGVVSTFRSTSIGFGDSVRSTGFEADPGTQVSGLLMRTVDI